MNPTTPRVGNPKMMYGEKRGLNVFKWKGPEIPGEEAVGLLDDEHVRWVSLKRPAGSIVDRSEGMVLVASVQ
jgi:hypothetical protein